MYHHTPFTCERYYTLTYSVRSLCCCLAWCRLKRLFIYCVNNVNNFFKQKKKDYENHMKFKLELRQRVFVVCNVYIVIIGGLNRCASCIAVQYCGLINLLYFSLRTVTSFQRYLAVMSFFCFFNSIYSGYFTRYIMFPALL